MSNRGNVLVTGGAGYIGSHACKALSRAGYLPIAYDNLTNGHEWAVKWGPLERGDILDRRRLDDVLIKYKPTAILHFAAFAYVGESVKDPGKYYRNNVSGSLNLLEAARDNHITSLVFSSTCATYGIPDKLPITEEAVQRPINPYGASKLMVERMIADFGAAHGIRSIILRYFNAAGADPDNEIGEQHAPETHLIPLLLDAATGRRPNITVYGTDYDTPDGTCIRDYIHVSDLAEAHVAAIILLENNNASRIFNIGTGTGYSVKQVIDTVCRIVGVTVPVTYGSRRAGDPSQLISDASRAREELTWTPRITSLEGIISTAWAWHQRGYSLSKNIQGL